MADEISLESVLAQPAAEPVAKPAKGERSLEDVMGVSTEGQSYFPGLIKRTAATAAGVGDFIWGLLPQAVGVGADLGTRISGAATGEDRRVTAQAAQMASQWASDPISNPLQKLMVGLGYGEDYSSSDVSKGLKWLSENIDKGAEWIEKNTKGHVLKEDAQSLFNTLTLGVLNLRKGGFFKDTPPSEKLGKGPIGGENRGTYYEPEHVEAKAAEATAEVTTPLPPPALSRAAQLSGDMADPFVPGEPGSGLPKPEAPAAKPGEVSLESVMPEAFQIGTAGAKTPKAETTKPYDNLPGGTEPREAGGYTGPGAEYEPTATKPSLGERFVELWRNDRRWTPSDKLSVALGATVTGSMLLDPDKWKEFGLVGGAALAVKGKGGMWHPEAVTRLAEPLKENLGRVIGDQILDEAAGRGPNPAEVTAALQDLGVRNPQWGFADPRLLARLAAIGLGATAGAYLGDDAKSALIGAGVGLGLSVVKPSAAIALFKKITAPDTRMRINHLADDYDTAVGRAGLAAWQLQQKVEQLVPSVEGRKKITYALDEGDFSLLSPPERAAANLLKNALEETGKQAKDTGVLRDMLDNYITHLWGKDALKKIDEIVQRVGGPNMSPESRFALKRKFSTLAEGKRAGLEPLTEDASAITGIYLNSISRSMANKGLLDSLKGQVEPTTGNRVVQGAREAPGNYVSIDHPQMRGLRVHPDIAPSLRFVFDATEPGTILRGLEAVSIATKRSAVSFSLFHAKALTDAFVGAAKMKPGYIVAGAAAGALVGSDDPITYALIGAGAGMLAPGIKHIAQAAAPKIFGENKYLKGLRTADPKMAEMIDLSIQGGLKYQLKGQRAALEDVYGTHDQFYKALKWLQGQADAAIPGAGLAVKGIEKVNRGVDTFMWERLHAGMKLQIFAEKYETLLQNNAKAHETNPRVPLKSKQELAGIAASFTNDIFGGLNWRRAAEQARTKWGRDLSLAAFSPTGRRVMQVLLFAPDWTLSTARAAVQTFGKGTNVRGLLEPQTLADLHRQYIVRSALYYAAMGDGLNYAMSGHHLWENQDWTTLDVGDGRKMQWSKHTMEPVHWVTKPGQQMLNKLAYPLKEPLNQLMGTEYLSTSGHAPRMQSRLGHAIKSLSPISVQQSFEAGEGSGIAGFMGSPIYGKTYQQRDTEKRVRQLERSLGVTR